MTFPTHHTSTRTSHNSLTKPYTAAPTPSNGLTAMITKVNFQPLTNPSRNPHTKVVKRWIKIATWSAIASLILLTSLEKNPTKTNRRLVSISFICVADLHHIWVSCFPSERVLPHPYSFHHHPFQRPWATVRKPGAFAMAEGFYAWILQRRYCLFPGKVILPANSFTSRFLLLPQLIQRRGHRHPSWVQLTDNGKTV